MNDLQVSGSLTGRFNVIDIFRQAPVCSEENYPQEFQGEGNESDPYKVSNIYDLQCMQSNLTADYELVNDIDASNTEEWNRNESKGVYQGFKPIGGKYDYLSESNGCDTGDKFCGSLEGNDHQITNLHLNWSDKYYVGLIGYAQVEDQHEGVNIKNLDIAQSHVRGERYTGTLIGRTGYEGSNVEAAELENIRVSSGEVKTDGNEIGGLIGTSGFLQGGLRLRTSSFSGTVEGQNQTGGLIGRMRHLKDSIKKSFSKGSVTGTDKVGGLVGEIDENPNYKPVRQSYSIMDVSGDNQVGGLLGYSQPAGSTLVVNQSFFAGNFNGGSKSGALYGELKYNDNNGDDEYLNVYWDEDISGITNPDNCYGTKDSADVIVNCDSGNFKLGTNTMQGLNSDQNMVKLEFESEGGPWRVQEGDYPALAWEIE